MIFHKAQGTGNDFIIIENKLNKSVSYYSSLSKKLCDRHYFVGADGVILLSHSRVADARVKFINCDGTIGEMCGNGARCAAAFLLKKSSKNSVVLESDIGTIVCKKESDGLYSAVIKDIIPVWTNRYLCIGSDTVLCSYIEVGPNGVPHLIVFSSKLYSTPNNILKPVAQKLRHLSILPKGANVTFCHQADEGICAKTFERGVEDFTLSCGTASAATAVALNSLCNNSFLSRAIPICFPGGKLILTVGKENKSYSSSIIGPAEITFSGKTDKSDTD